MRENRPVRSGVHGGDSARRNSVGPGRGHRHFRLVSHRHREEPARAAEFKRKREGSPGNGGFGDRALESLGDGTVRVACYQVDGFVVPLESGAAQSRVSDTPTTKDAWAKRGEPKRSLKASRSTGVKTPYAVTSKLKTGIR